MNFKFTFESVFGDELGLHFDNITHHDSRQHNTRLSIYNQTPQYRDPYGMSLNRRWVRSKEMEQLCDKDVSRKPKVLNLYNEYEYRAFMHKPYKPKLIM